MNPIFKFDSNFSKKFYNKVYQIESSQEVDFTVKVG